MKCRSCNGSGKHRVGGFRCGSGPLAGPFSELRDCFLCDGTGQEIEERVRWRAEGEAMRNRRKAAGETFRDVAERLGVEIHEVSDMERGYREPIG